MTSRNPGTRIGSYRSLLVVCLLTFAATLYGQQVDHSNHQHHEGHAMQMDASGMVMNENHSELPRDCPEISGDVAFTIRAGTEYAQQAPGLIFGMSQHELRVEPCTRVEITFINEDQVRHQWMVHGLPSYLYPGGMFHIEASGGNTQRGTFIVPGDDKTYLVHCDLAQHMEKGMRGQLVVGTGSGDLWGVPGISSGFFRSAYLPGFVSWLLLAVLVMAFGGSFWLARNR